jgi:transketolase
MSPGHLSILGYGLQWLLGRNGGDKRLANPQAIIDTFRIPDGLPGHIEAGIGDIPFGTGPLGKGVSNALGAAFGLKYLKKPGTVDVLLADGDAQEGQVPEALRLASHLETDNLVVHGDFNDIQLSDMPSKTVASDFSAIAHASGWHVIEVQNGNDPAQVTAALDAADKFLGKGRPIFICYYTTMGYGIDFMEEGSNTGDKNYHGAPLSEEEAEKASSTLQPLAEAVKEYKLFHSKEKSRYESKPPVETDIEIDLKLKGYKRTLMEGKGAARKEFGALHLKNLMKADERIVVLHADLAGSGGFTKVEKEFPNRVINVGVAEANMYMMAAGMRQTGLIPVTYTFAAFGTNEARANARLIDINCGHTRCGILNDCTHVGLSVGEDGETHQEQNYLNIPFHHTEVWMPGDSNQAGAMAERALEIVAEGHESVYVFSARSGHEQLTTPHGDLLYGQDYRYDGKIDLVRGTGELKDQVTILATGIAVHDAVAAADVLREGPDSISVRVLNVSSVRPIDSATVIQAALETSHLIVVEDHNIDGGLATQVADIIADFALPCSLRRLGITQYLPSGPSNDLKLIAGLDIESIIDAVQDEVRSEVRGSEDALVTALHELAENITHSRFEKTARPFIDKLLREKDYLTSLREAWAARECSKEKLPSNDALMEKLKGE